MLMRNEMAGLGRRGVAVVVDLMAVSLLAGIALREMALPPLGMEVVRYSIMLIYSTVFLCQWGQTPGKMLMRLRVIGSEGGTVVPRQAFCRALAKWTPIFVVFAVLMVLLPSPAELHQMVPELGDEQAEPLAMDSGRTMGGHIVAIAGVALVFFLVLVTRRHPDRQALHDRVADTYVVAMS